MQMLGAAAGNTALSVGAKAAPGLLANIPKAAGLFSGLFGGDKGVRNKNILAGGLGGISALSSIASGNAEAKALEGQAEQTSLVAKQQALAGKEGEIRLREQLSASKGNLIASLGASGISGGSLVTTTLAQAEAAGQSEIAGLKAGTRAQVLSTKQTARSQEQLAKTARKEGKFGAFGKAASFASRLLQRGTV